MANETVVVAVDEVGALGRREVVAENYAGLGVREAKIPCFARVCQELGVCQFCLPGS
jgi:hypothetical protein